MVLITGRASSFLENLFLKTPISIQIKSKSNPNQIHSLLCSSFFLCLQGQPELCGVYHLLLPCFSFFVHLHDHPEPFGSCIILQFALLSSSVSTANLSCLLTTTFSSPSFLSNSFSSLLFNLLRVARCCFCGLRFLTTFSFPLVVFWFSFLLYLLRILSSAFLSSVLQSLCFKRGSWT